MRLPMDRTTATETVRRVEALLRRTCRAGLRSLSSAAAAELGALEKSAHAAGLVHLERDLAGLATEIGRFLDRSPQFRTVALVGALARTREHARAAARVLAMPPGPEDDAVLGVARRRYAPVAGTLLVEAVAASGFVTDAGFTGVSVTLVAPETGEESIASIVRPSDWFGDDPRRLWFQPVSEVTPLTVAELAHGAWRLDDVRRSSDGRLSLHAGLQAMPAAPAPARALAPYRVAGLREGVERLARDLDAAEADAAVRICVDGLRPGPVSADETRGTATVSFTDRRGLSARMVVPLLPRNDLLLDNLARLRDQPPGAILGRLSAGPSGLRFEPQTAWFDQPVRLQHKRAGPVLEVHLGLEPLTGPVDRGAASAPPPAPAAPDAAQEAVGQVLGLLVELFATGTARPEDLGGDLLAAAARADEVGLAGVAGAARAVSDALAAGADATEPLFAATARCRLVDRGLALARLAEDAPPAAAAEPAPPRRGADRVLWPLGVVRDGGRATIVAVDAADGSRWTVRDDWRDVRPGWVASRLFHGERDARELLGHTWVFTDHPASRAREGRELAPAWHTAPTLGPPVRDDAIPSVDAPGPGVCRCEVEARRGPDGWVLSAGDEPVAAELSDAVELELDKRGTAVRFVGRFAAVGGTLRLLTVDGVHPEVDPAATRWSFAEVAERARGTPLAPLVEALGRGAMPPVPDDPVAEQARLLPAAEGRRLVQRCVAQTRRNVAAGEPLPSAWILWSWGRALGLDPPIAGLSLPTAAVRRAVVRPLARWLAGAPDADPTEALWLLAGTGERDLHLAGAPS